MGGAEFGGIIEIVVGVLAVIMFTMWIVLPYIAIGIKSRIDRLIELLTIDNETALEASRFLDKLASGVGSSLKT